MIIVRMAYFCSIKFLYMFTRRHIRIKVMQSIYALQKDPEQTVADLKKNYHRQLQATYELYFVLYALLLHLFKKHKEQFKIKTQQEFRKRSSLENSQHLVNNKVLIFLENHTLLNTQLKRKKITHWELHFEYVDQLLRNLESKSFYKRYMEADSHTWESDRNFVLGVYKEVVAPNDPLFDFLEDQQLGWADDFSLVNTFVLKQLKRLDAKEPRSLQYPVPEEQQDEIQFGIQLLETAIGHQEALHREIEDKTPNWESDRMAQLDLVLLQLGVAELLFFESIPPKVTLNEYLEIAKDYSTPKSNIFINGVLDKLAKEFSEANRMKKTGRGLMD